MEIIVFTYGDESSAGNELFAPPAPLAAPENPGAQPGEGPVFDDRTPGSDPEADAGDAEPSDLPAGDVPADDLPADDAVPEVAAQAGIAFERIEPEAFMLQDTWRKLVQVDVYRPILHAAWTQTTREKNLSPTLPLRYLGDPPPGLDGSITLYQSRFLHLDVDLSLDAAGADTSRNATDRLISQGTAGSADALEDGGLFRPPVRYRIREDRIMHDGELRYFDHPRFGLLARVTRLDPPL